MVFVSFRAMLRCNVRVDTAKVDGLPKREVEEHMERRMMGLHS